MHPSDALALHLADGARVRLVGPRDAAAVTLRVTDRQLPGHLFVSMHFREAAANRLVPRTVDAASGTPPFKRGRARVEPVERDPVVRD
jgi:assimilatory nitrate reductase catalytic subunit